MCLVKRYYVLSVWLSLMTSFLSSTTIFASRNSWLRVPFSFKSLCLNVWNLNIILKESFYFQNKVTVKEVKFKKEYLNDEDVFLIDLGLQIFQVHFYCQTKRLFTWENSHQHEFHIEVTFLFRIAFTLWLGDFIPRCLKVHFVLKKYKINHKHYACATRSRLPVDRFHTETCGRYMIPLGDFVLEWNSRLGTTTGVNSRRGDSRWQDTLWWYHVNKCRAMRGSRSELIPARKSPRCHVNSP